METYLTSQLTRFQDGIRGYHYQDAEGLRMRPMSRALITTTGTSNPSSSS